MRIPSELKSPFKSRTNIVAFVLGILGLVQFFGFAPSVIEAFFGLIVAVGAVLVIYFRTWTSSILRE